MKEPTRPDGRHGSILSYTKSKTEIEAREPVQPDGPDRLEANPRVAAEEHRPAVVPEWQPLIHPAKVLNGILRSPRLIAAATIGGALLGVLVALSSPKFYDAY